jgi:putative FmdB family regulatory protein
MPTYDYRCDACGHEFELFQSITAPVQKKCPACGKLKLQRLIGTGAGILFKGGGFYETDYRSESYKKSAEAETKAASGGAEKSEAKTDAKAEQKAESKAEKPASDAGAKPSGASPKESSGVSRKSTSSKASAGKRKRR